MLMSNSHLQWGDMHTYFEVQLSAPGVTSYGAVWVGFPVLRQCFTDFLGWTQTTNNPSQSDLYRLTLKDGGYVLDDQVKPFEVSSEVIKVTRRDGTMREDTMTIRRTVHGPVVADRNGMTVAMRVAAIDRPRLFEQFWRMGLAKNLAEWKDAMRMQQLPIFHTAYADRDGHIGYVFNATLPVHPTGDSILAGGGARRSIGFDLVNDRAVRSGSAGVRPANRLGAELQRHAVDVGVSDDARLDEVCRRLRGAAGHHAARATRHPHPQRFHRQEDDVCRRESRQAVDPRRDGRSVRRRSRRRGASSRQRSREARRRRPREVGSPVGGHERRHAAVLPVHDRGRQQFPDIGGVRCRPTIASR